MRRVLIVESDLASGMECLRTFAVAGFQVEHVSTSGETMTALDRPSPDVIVLNLLFRGGQAMQILRAIRSHPRASKVPVVAFARAKVESQMDEARIEGATECVVLGQRGAQELVSAANKILPQPAASVAEPAPQVAPAAPMPAPPTSPPATPQVKEAAPAATAKTAPPGQEPAPPKEEPSPKLSPLPALKDLSRRLFGAPDQATRQMVLIEMQEKAHALGAEEGALGSPYAVNLARGLAAFLRELCEKPRLISSSVVRTVGQSVDALEKLLALPAASATQPSPQLRILAVDDEPSVRHIVERALATVQLTPDSAGNTEEALERSRNQRYDLFILDINMPGPSGFELCQKLRASSIYRDTPVIFLTAMDDFQNRMRSASSGGNDFIGKPFLPRELALKALIHLLSRCNSGLLIPWK